MEFKPVNPYGWDNMTDQEKLDHVKHLGDVILENRYRYYVLDENKITDVEYDYLERTYEYVCNLLNLKPDVLTMVGWNPTYPGAKEAEERVLTREKIK